jgi:ferredoxin--NADP+ reductase
MEAADPVVAPGELADCPESTGNAESDRNLAILRGFAEREPRANAGKLHLRFLVSPTEVIADASGKVSGLRLEKNRLEVRHDGTVAARGTGKIETLDVGMVLPAIGYVGERIAGVPYDEKARTVANQDGRVIDSTSGEVIANEYVVGWARSGPKGLIGEHKRASAHVVGHMVADSAGLADRELPQRDEIVTLLRRRGVQVVSFTDWQQLDDVEVARGARRGAPRDKIVDVAAMLEVLGQD